MEKKGYILIADGGSTKVDWVLVGGGQQWFASTSGMNPYVLVSDQLEGTVRMELLPQLGEEAHAVHHIYFYGAGCSNAVNVRLVADALASVFPQAETWVGHDLLGAARALCGREAGVVCILGTGSNCCHYDGRQLQRQLLSLGYLAGDEGSGYQMGKMLMQGYCHGTLPQHLLEAFREYSEVESPELVAALYASQRPNAFLAGLVPFIKEHLHEAAMQTIVWQCFDDFIQKNVRPLGFPDAMPLHFTGSVAFHFRGLLAERLSLHGLKMGSVLQKPIEGLVAYHLAEEC